MKDNDIIKILEKNRLYDDRTEIEIYSNLIEDFLKSYNYNSTNKHYFPQNIVRDKNGYINLLDIPFITSNNKEEGHTNKFWILLNNGSKILLKEITDIKNAEKEFLFDELAKELNISVATYDIVKFNNTLYLSSSSFLDENEFLFDKYDFERKKTQNSKIELHEIKETLKKIDSLSIREQFLKTVFIDRLTDNFDRIPHNLKVVISSSGIKRCPLYDNDKCCDKDFKKKNMYKIFSHDNKYDSESIFRFLLSNTDFDKYIKTIKLNINIDKICTLIKNNNSIIISSQSINEFSNTINENIKVLNKSLNFR